MTTGDSRQRPTLSAGALTLSETEMRAWQGLLHGYHEVIRALDKELRSEHGFSLAAYDVLLRLANAEEAGLRMSELAERVMLTPSGVTRTVETLMSKSLVERRRDPGDGRATRVSLTKAGRQALRDAARTHLSGIRQHFTGRLDDDQLQDIANAFETLVGPHQPH